MPWGDVAFDTDLATKVFGDLVGAPALDTGDVEVGKPSGAHMVMIAAGLGRPERHRLWRCKIERFGRGGPAEHPPGAVVEFGSDGVEVILGEAAQVSLLVQVLAQQSVGVLVGAALPRVVVVSLVIADSLVAGHR